MFEEILLKDKSDRIIPKGSMTKWPTTKQPPQRETRRTRRNVQHGLF